MLCEMSFTALAFRRNFELNERERFSHRTRSSAYDQRFRRAYNELDVLLPTLSAGMAPKMEACLRAVRGGVASAHVLDGRLPHAILLEIFTDEGIGTMVRA